MSEEAMSHEAREYFEFLVKNDARLRFHTDRERMLMDNLRRWRKVADIEHARTCTERHDCSRAVERIYGQLLEEELQQ